METIKNRIWFKTEGDPEKWESTCLPIGNGYMGATFFGGIEKETVVLNEKTLWAGGPSPDRPGYNGGNRPGAYKSVKKVRELLKDGKYSEAEKLLPELTCSTDKGFGAYQLLGKMVIEFVGIDKNDVTDYKRSLDLDEAVYRCGFVHNGKKHERTAFASYPDRAIALRFSSDELNMKIHFEDLPDGAETEVRKNVVCINGALSDNGMRYSLMVVIAADEGAVSSENGIVSVTAHSDAAILLSAGTDYSDMYPSYRKESGISCTAFKNMEHFSIDGYHDFFERHTKDYSSLFARAKLSLNNVRGDIPDVETLLSEYKNGSVEAATVLETLYFQYGRYLLIASSREGSLPANLQGVWNNSNNPPWCCDYHINVNLQMNYWGAFSTNLSDTAEPLVRYLDSMRLPGRITAKEYYNIVSDENNPENGWIAHTQSTPFGWTSPGWDFYWGWSTAAVAWLMLNIYDHYDFTRDEKFLRERIYPIMRESARFYTQWLIWDENQQRLVSSPTYSPEHGPVTVGNTYEQSLILEFYKRFIQLEPLFPEDEELFGKVKEQAEQLKPFSVSRTGLLKEWFEEDEPGFDRSKIQMNHRHISHLMSLYPGSMINSGTPDLMKAAIATMNDRGDESTGWARAYKVNLWARTGDGERAYKLLHGLLTDCTYPNLWDFHPPFQIDGNFGGSAGIAEMLLQSHEPYIKVLPALPPAWKDGEFEGLCARGGFEVSAKWQDHKPKEIAITSLVGNDVTVFTELSGVFCGGEAIKLITENVPEGCLRFKTEKGKTYMIR